MLTVFLFAVANAGLGFAVAVHLARRHRALASLPPDDFGWQTPTAVVRPYVPSPAPLPADLNPAVDVLAEPDPAPPEELPAAEEGEAEPVAVETIETPDQASSPWTPPVRDLQDRIGQYGRRITELDGEVRAGAVAGNLEAFDAWIASLKQTKVEYIEARGDALKSLETVCHEREDWKAVCDDVQDALNKQNAQFHQCEENLAGIAPDSPVEQWQKQLLAEAAKLLGANDNVRDAVELAEITLARIEQPSIALPRSQRVDPETGVTSRAGLEAELAEFWQKDPHHVRQLSVALLDIDQFTRVNEHYGYAVGNRILSALARLMRTEGRDAWLTARYCGQRFLILMADVDLRSATSVADRVRQTIELCHFKYQESDIQVTLSGGVTQAAAQDSTESIFERAEAALREAKRYGRTAPLATTASIPRPSCRPTSSSKTARSPSNACPRSPRRAAPVL